MLTDSPLWTTEECGLIDNIFYADYSLTPRPSCAAQGLGATLVVLVTTVSMSQLTLAEGTLGYTKGFPQIDRY